MDMLHNTTEKIIVGNLKYETSPSVVALLQVNFTKEGPARFVVLTEESIMVSFISCSNMIRHLTLHAPRSSVNKVLVHSWPPPTSGAEILCSWICPLLGVSLCSQCQSWVTGNLLNATVCCGVHGKLTGTSDNVQWQQLMVSLLALRQTALSVCQSILAQAKFVIGSPC